MRRGKSKAAHRGSGRSASILTRSDETARSSPNLEENPVAKPCVGLQQTPETQPCEG